MPYIDQGARNRLKKETARNPGELNYKITVELIKYAQQKGLSYAVINDIIGAVEGAKLEFYRRIAAPYENTKITQNGDVY